MSNVVDISQARAARANSEATPRSSAKHRRTISPRERRELKARAREMQARRMTQAEISKELGLSRSATAALLPKTIKTAPDAINGETLVEWIRAHSEKDAHLGLMIQGQVLTESQERAYHRWRDEGVNPRLNSVEAALAFWGQTMFFEFEQWAEDHRLPVWARGQAPAWWNDEGDSRVLEDLRSSDPEWVREARVVGVTIPEHAQELIAA